MVARNFLLCALVLVLVSASDALGRRLRLFPAAMTNASIEHQLNAFLAANDLRGFRKWLKEDNVDINTRIGEHSATLLHLTARSGRVSFVHQLLEDGADVEAGDRYGITPLDEAEFWDRPAVFARLRVAGATTVAEALAANNGGADNLPPRSATHNHLKQVLAKFTPKINYWTVCADYLLRCMERVSFLRRSRELYLYNRKKRTRLQEAVAQGKTSVVELLLIGRRYRRVLYEEDREGWQAVHYAAFHGRTVVLEMLQQRGADINAAVHFSGHTPLTLAALMGQATTLQRLLEMGANPNQRDYLGMDALQLAVLGMHTETVKVLLQHGLAKETITAARQLATTKNATRHGYVDLLAMLDNASPRSPAVMDGHDFNVLQQAVIDSDLPRVKAILKQDRALLHATTIGEWTAAHHAAVFGYTDMMELLYSAGADFNAVGVGGSTPALIAASNGNLAALSFLYKIQALNHTSEGGENILHLAVEGRHVHVARWLVHKGFNLRLRTNAGESALDIAKRLSNQEMIDILDRTEIGFYKGSGRFYIGPADQD